MKKTLSLVAKLARIMKSVDRIQKRGHNDLNDYDYVRDEDVLDALRDKMARASIIVTPEVIESRRYPVILHLRGGDVDSFVTEQRVRFTFFDGDNIGRSLVVVVEGAGEDACDKGAYKALTGALKQCLLKTFLMPTGNDPEKDSKTTAREVREKKVEAAQEVGAAKVAGTYQESSMTGFPLFYFLNGKYACVYGTDDALAANKETLMFHGSWNSNKKAYLVPKEKLDDMVYVLNQMKVAIKELDRA
jgi:hypothetical protein